MSETALVAAVVPDDCHLVHLRAELLDDAGGGFENPNYEHVNSSPFLLEVLHQPARHVGGAGSAT